MLKLSTILIFSFLFFSCNYSSDRTAVFNYLKSYGLQENTNAKLYAFYPGNQCGGCIIVDNKNKNISNKTVILHHLKKAKFTGFEHIIFDSLNVLQSLKILDYGNKFILIFNDEIKVVLPIKNFQNQADSLLKLY